MDWLDLLAVQGTLKSLFQHHSSKASSLLCSAFFIVQLSHPYLNTGKTITLTRLTFVGKVMSLLFNMLSRLVITFLPRSKYLLISWLQSPSAVILDMSHYFADPKINGIHIKVPTFFESIYLVSAFNHKYKNLKQNDYEGMYIQWQPWFQAYFMILFFHLSLSTVVWSGHYSNPPFCRQEN